VWQLKGDQAMANPVQERIEREINEHDVVLFMKGTPVAMRFFQRRGPGAEPFGRQIQGSRRADAIRRCAKE
jgi:hypothetical protein